MENLINFEKEFPLFSDSCIISSDLDQKTSTEFQFSPSSYFLDDINPDDFNISFASKKNLFKTKKIKTKFITFKYPIYPIHSQKEKVPEMNLSNGRWTRQERIKFAEAIYRFGMDWKKIKEYIATRNIKQLRSHAQKFLYKLKNDKFIEKKGLDFKKMNWQQSLKYLKEKLTGQELLDVLYSIETEMEDNKRMTERYLERKRIRLKKDTNLNTNNESLNSSSNSTCDVFNNDSNKNQSCKQKDESLEENNYKNILLPLEESEDNQFIIYLNKGFEVNKKDIEFNNEFIKSNCDENIYDEFSIEQESPIKYKNRLDFIKI
jgi:SHAQKYF class myb-like DNA-binding protein